MSTDYTAAISTVIALVVVLGGMTTYVLSRPSDLTPRTR
jgi:hypothetical protein